MRLFFLRLFPSLAPEAALAHRAPRPALGFGERLRRTVARARAWGAARLADLRQRPPQPGMASGTVASQPEATADLRWMASSPGVYAAVQRRAYGLQIYPIRCSLGYGPGAAKELLDPDRVPWVATLLVLLGRPDPADELRTFPARPGEMLLAQLLADVLLPGNAYVRSQYDKKGNIIGLHRLHPRRVRLVRVNGAEYWEHSPPGATPELIPRGDVAHIRLLSWEDGGAGEMGTGAAESLRALLMAESAALRATASTISQGGVDIVVKGTTTAMQNWLKVKENRESVAAEFSQALSSGSGRRIYVVGGDFAAEPTGFAPADLKAPDLLDAAKGAELMALGTTPVSVGSDATTYATAVQQVRVQAELDEQLAMILEACLLRPLAQHFARKAEGRWGQRSRQVSCWIDLSSHPGKQYMRTEALNRMKTLIEMGWSPTQAALAENIELPPPEGDPAPAAADPAAADPAAPAPLGDNQGATPEPGAPQQSGRGDPFWETLIQ